MSSGVGHIVSPNYPLPVQETLECFYKIVVAKGNKIKLNIVDLELTTETYPGMLCKEDFLEVCIYRYNEYLYVCVCKNVIIKI